MADFEYDDEEMEKICDAIDFDGIKKLVRSEYERGRADERKAGTASAEQLAAEYQRGQDDYRDGLLRELDSRRTKPKAPLAKSIEETGQSGTPKPEKRTDEAPAARETASGPNIGGRPRLHDDRPPKCPSNFEMAFEALKELKEPSSAPAILMFVRNRWWPGCPEAWKSNLIEFAKRGKLRKDGLNYALPLTPQEKIDAAPKRIVREQPEVLPKEPAKAPMPAVRPTEGPRPEFVPRVAAPDKKLGPPARGGHVMAFKHLDKTVLLHQREFAIAQCLRAAMGRGHIDTQFLAQKALGVDKRNAIDNESLLRDLVSIMNPKLAMIRLTVEFHKGFGFVMKELQ